MRYAELPSQCAAKQLRNRSARGGTVDHSRCWLRTTCRPPRVPRLPYLVLCSSVGTLGPPNHAARCFGPSDGKIRSEDRDCLSISAAVDARTSRRLPCPARSSVRRIIHLLDVDIFGWSISCFVTLCSVTPSGGEATTFPRPALLRNYCHNPKQASPPSLYDTSPIAPSHPPSGRSTPWAHELFRVCAFAKWLGEYERSGTVKYGEVRSIARQHCMHRSSSSGHGNKSVAMLPPSKSGDSARPTPTRTLLKHDIRRVATLVCI